MSVISSPVPFVRVGNRRALSDEQLVECPYLADFVRRFSASFERDDNARAYLFIEPEE